MKFSDYFKPGDRIRLKPGVAYTSRFRGNKTYDVVRNRHGEIPVRRGVPHLSARGQRRSRRHCPLPGDADGGFRGGAGHRNRRAAARVLYPQPADRAPCGNNAAARALLRRDIREIRRADPKGVWSGADRVAAQVPSPVAGRCAGNPSRPIACSRTQEIQEGNGLTAENPKRATAERNLPHIRGNPEGMPWPNSRSRPHWERFRAAR